MMRVITRRKIIDYYSENSYSQNTLEEWVDKTKKTNWRSFRGLKKRWKRKRLESSQIQEYRSPASA